MKRRAHDNGCRHCQNFILDIDVAKEALKPWLKGDMKEIRIPKERLVQFIRQEAASMAGISLDQLGVCAIFMQTDEGHRPLDVIVDYEPRDPHNWFIRCSRER